MQVAISSEPSHNLLFVKQWLKIYDLCHTFLQVALVRKHTDMLELNTLTC